MQHNFMKMMSAALMPALCLMWWPVPATAQNDSITLITGRPVRGTIQSVTPESLVVNTSDGNKTVEPWNVRRIRFADEPNELTRAKTGYTDDRFNVCVQELDGLETPDRDVVRQEAEFYKALASARIALNGGNVTASTATSSVEQFVQTNPNSFHLYEALDALGDLYLAQGQFDKAEEQFGKTAAGTWPEYAFRAKLKTGRSQLLRGDHSAAIQSFEDTERANSSSDFALQAKLVARCLRAQAIAMSGDPAEGRRMATEIIQSESPKNAMVFAYANNAIGASYLQENLLKEAVRSYLKTELLFTIDPDSHAEALYHLQTLWDQLEQPGRASAARQKINDRYRNTYWATKSRP
ncbi:MAG: hypothetical protein ACR2NP_15870 [Pirellulaceae bacterium]